MCENESCVAQPPHPRPLSLKGRGEQDFAIAGPFTDCGNLTPVFPPSPLEGEGPGVRGLRHDSPLATNSDDP